MWFAQKQANSGSQCRSFDGVSNALKLQCSFPAVRFMYNEFEGQAFRVVDKWETRLISGKDLNHRAQSRRCSKSNPSARFASYSPRISVLTDGPGLSSRLYFNEFNS
jgi:hypothetical protein